tara:strand:+ start:553 stop:708 length:156 start_codon:yes stop_codon:yes gene_type:complete
MEEILPIYNHTGELEPGGDMENMNYWRNGTGRLSPVLICENCDVDLEALCS